MNFLNLIEVCRLVEVHGGKLYQTTLHTAEAVKDYHFGFGNQGIGCTNINSPPSGTVHAFEGLQSNI